MSEKFTFVLFCEKVAMTVIYEDDFLYFINFWFILGPDWLLNLIFKGTMDCRHFIEI
jgi:hypothetical protein